MFAGHGARGGSSDDMEMSHCTLRMQFDRHFGVGFGLRCAAISIPARANPLTPSATIAKRLPATSANPGTPCDVRRYWPFRQLLS